MREPSKKVKSKKKDYRKDVFDISLLNEKSEELKVTLNKNLKDKIDPELVAKLNQQVDEIKDLSIEFEKFYVRSRDLIGLLDYEGNFVWANLAWKKYLGYLPKEIIGKNFKLFIHPDDIETTIAEAKKIISGKESESFINRYRHKDGSIKWLKWNSIADKKSNLIYISARNITKEKEYEHQIKKLASIPENNPVPMLEIDDKGKVIFANHSAKHIFPGIEQTPKDHPIITGMSYLFPLLRRSNLKVMTKDIRYQNKFYHQVISYIKDEDKILVIVYDNTEKMNLEIVLKAREQVLQLVNYLAEVLLSSTSWKDSIEKILSKLGFAMNASRVYIFQNYNLPEGQLESRQLYEWTNVGIEKQIDNPKLKNFNYKKLGFQRWADVLSTRNIINNKVKDLPKSEKKLLTDQDIKALLIVPIFSGTKWWGFIGFDNCAEETIWSEIIVTSLQTAASIIGHTIKREEFETQLKTTAEELTKFNKLMIGRELRMIEIKQQLEEIKSKKIESKTEDSNALHLSLNKADDR